MSHIPKKGGEGGTPGDRRGSKPDTDFKAEILKMFAEIRQSEKNMEDKLEHVNTRIEQVDTRIGKMDQKIDETVRELRGQIKDVSKRTQSLEEGMKKTRVEMKEVKREEEKLKTGLFEVNKTQEEVWDAIAMNELRQREVNLRLRAVPETQGENIREKLTIEIAQWLAIQKEEVERSVQNAFRIRTRTTRTKKMPGDCLITFKDKDMRNLILQKNRERRLNIDGNYIIIFKDIPVRLLKRRDPYKPLVQILKKNKIEFKWEFPQGISFTYKSKKHRLISPEETSKFQRRYRELTVEEEEERGAVGGVGLLERKYLEEKGKENGESEDEEEEEEEEEGEEQEEARP